MEEGKDQKVVEFVNANEYRSLDRLADSNVSRIPRNQNFSRRDVVNAFQDAFEMIGGTTRLAQWANEDPSQFFKLYARLLPSQASSALGESNTMIVKHVLPRTALDGGE